MATRLRLHVGQALASDVILHVLYILLIIHAERLVWQGLGVDQVVDRLESRGGLGFLAHDGQQVVARQNLNRPTFRFAPVFRDGPEGQRGVYGHRQIQPEYRRIGSFNRKMKEVRLAYLAATVQLFERVALASWILSQNELMD